LYYGCCPGSPGNIRCLATFPRKIASQQNHARNHEREMTQVYDEIIMNNN
jgi:hypothetical protein